MMSEFFKPDLLLITAAFCMLISLAEAWIVSLIYYAKFDWLKKIFKAPHELIRSHVDYTIMTALLCITFFMSQHFEVALPWFTVAALVVGSLYNPFGFILKSINPRISDTKTLLDKVVVLAGFVPATYGYGHAMILNIQAGW